MESKIDPGFVYEDTELGITENDIDLLSDLWEMDGREVYRGSLDPRYSHANVYWLYGENLERVGLVEHSKIDHAVFHLLWYQDSEFGTLLQEDWTTEDDLWSKLPRTVFDRFVNEGWTAVDSFLEQCLYGPVRIVTPDILQKIPSVYTCSTCKRKSLKPIAGCQMTSAPLDFPVKEKLFFVDTDFVVHIPPQNSTVWFRLGFTQAQQQRGDGSLHPQQQAQVQERESLLQTEPTLPPLPDQPAPSAPQSS